MKERGKHNVDNKWMKYSEQYRNLIKLYIQDNNKHITNVQTELFNADKDPKHLSDSFKFTRSSSTFILYILSLSTIIYLLLSIKTIISLPWFQVKAYMP